MRRIPRAPAPYFKVPPPYNPQTGQFAKIGGETPYTRVAMFTILEEHADYLICKGYDPETQTSYDRIAVAKPYLLQRSPWDGQWITLQTKDDSCTVKYEYQDTNDPSTTDYAVGDARNPSCKRRLTYDSGSTLFQEMSPYWIGEVIAAAKPKTKFGDTPGISVSSNSNEGSSSDNGIVLKDRDFGILYEQSSESATSSDETDDQDKKPIWYMDLNVYGRSWKNVDVHFELKDDKSPGGKAAAYLLKTDGTVNKDVGTIDVWDQTNGRQWRAFGRTTKGDGIGGARGRAMWNRDKKCYEILQMQEKSRLIMVSTAAAVTASSVFTATLTKCLDDGQSPLASGATTLSVTNFSSKIDAGATGIICIADGVGGYLVVDAPCSMS